MFPLRDDNPTEIFPAVTLALIATCVGVWVAVQGGGFDMGTLESSVCRFGAIPAELTGGEVEAAGRGGAIRCEPGGLTWSAVLTSLFLHGSWMHLLGNMWFLWIFGNNIEDSMGRLPFLLFYLVCGVVATGAHVASSPGSPVPVVGASGAISGVMGAYLLLYPRARVRTLLVLVVFITLVDLPAWVYLGYWFLLQLGSGLTPQGGMAGIAFWAHVGGFVAGLLLVGPLKKTTLVEAKREHRKLSRDEIEHGGWW